MARKNRELQVLETSVRVMRDSTEDYISLTDIARHRDAERSDDLIRNWVRNRNTLEFLGVWERIHNPDFNSVEFDGFKMQAGLNSFTLTPKQWREEHPGDKGNVRDQANAAQLVCLANLENLNALFIQEELEQSERLERLNRIAIEQMKLLTSDRGVGKLEGGA